MKSSDQDSVDSIAAQWNKERPDLEMQPMEIIGRFSRIYKYTSRAIEKCHQDFDLKPGEFDVLATLRRSGDPFTLTPSQLFNSMMLSSGAMTNRLDKLADKGLIKRIHSEEDRRSVYVSLTDKGLELINLAVEQHVNAEAELLEGLSEKQKDGLNKALRQWLAVFEDH
ncbi:MarR family transcriptional regulator [Hahella sp. CCB-MM4]|uniref:MarR family winged helix-turn-helix transcriptional regulator n=1 Tax=Hahella sp. (strain CCB-MM4) TaxID=1926491 RepID=UPI000B9BB4BE|nr:MarR family transcriptional regulator [Hahella sp. CCB-MM4]OZG75232.1 MarR family transcriptional regulator [Hahella sp. CCB-MM4]